jgi:hypothetical protein
VAANISTEAQEDLRQLLQAWAERHVKPTNLAEVEEIGQHVKTIAGQCVMEKSSAEEIVTEVGGRLRAEEAR